MHVDAYIDVHGEIGEMYDKAAAKAEDTGEADKIASHRRMREMFDERFRREMAILVALLALTGREGPAAERAERAKAILGDEESAAVIDAALRGEFPPSDDR